MSKQTFTLPSLKNRLHNLFSPEIVTIIQYSAFLSIPFLIGYIVVLSRTNNQLRVEIQMLNQNTKDLYSLKGELRELLAHEKNSVVVLDSYNTRVNDVLKNQLTENRKLLSLATEHTATTGAILANEPLGLVKVKSSAPSEVQIYDSPLKSSILSRVRPDDILFYFKKDSLWYQVEMKSQLGEMGWVEAKNVIEF